MGLMKSNSMIEPQYITGVNENDKLSVKTPALIFGCGVLTHENLLLQFDNASCVTLFDPDPFNVIPENVSLAGESLTVIKNWADVPENNQYETIVCFFSLHFISDWLDMVWHLHSLLKLGGTFLIAEDRGFRALLDFNYDLREELISKEIVHEVWNKFSQRIEDGFPWYPDISAGNMTLLRDILSPYYLYDLENDRRQYDLVRAYTPCEIKNYLPWIKDRWSFTDDHVPELDSLNIAEVNERVIIYKLTKKSDMLPPLWNFQNKEFMNNIWAVKLLYCHRALIRNTPVFKGETDETSKMGKKEESVRQFLNAYLTILYQHLLRHLPGGVAEFVALSPERFYEFNDPQMHENAFFKDLPVLTWNLERFKVLPKPSWYENYINQLVNESLKWAGEVFLIKNTCAFNYALKWDDPILSRRPFEHYYCAHFYDKVYCEKHKLDCNLPPDWEQRQVNPCIYMTVQASKAPQGNKDASQNEFNLSMSSELRYVGFVLYLPDNTTDVNLKNKYILIGSLVSHLLSYVQAQFTTFLAVTALESPLPRQFKAIYEGVDSRLYASVYNKLFPLSGINSQHSIEVITQETTRKNFSNLLDNEKIVLEHYIRNLIFYEKLSSELNEIENFFTNELNSKWLKAVIARGKNKVYLFDLYLYIVKKHLNNEYEQKLNLLDAQKASILREENVVECHCDYAFWYIIDAIDTLLAHDDMALSKIFIGIDECLLVTKGKRFPDIFFRKHESSLGSFGNYANKLTEVHRKLFHSEHYALYVKMPLKYSDLSDDKLKDVVAMIPSPPEALKYTEPTQTKEQKTKAQPRIVHLYISFEENNESYNALLLQNYKPKIKSHAVKEIISI